MHLASNEPVKPPVTPNTSGGINRIVIALMAIMLLLAAVLFVLLGPGGGTPVETIRPGATTAPSATLTTGSPDATPADGSASPVLGCAVSDQATCDGATFANYQPAHGRPYRAALLHATGAPVYTPAAGVITAAGSASYIDAQGQPVTVPDAYIEITASNGVVYEFVFRSSGSPAVVGSEVRAGDLLGTTAGSPIAFAEGEADVIFVIMIPGPGGLPAADLPRMRELFPAY